MAATAPTLILRSYTVPTPQQAERRGLGIYCLGALPESVLETSCKVPHVRHATGSSSASALGFVLVVVPAHLGSGSESTGCTYLLLNVEGSLSTTTADSVRLVISSARTADTFSHLVVLYVCACRKYVRPQSK